MRTTLAIQFLSIALAGCAAPGERAVTTYAGSYSKNSLPEDILTLREAKLEPSHLAAVAYAQPLYKVWDERAVWEWEVQGVKHWGRQDHVEFNALIALRWVHFPWDNYVRTSFAVGDGLSWASEIPKLELDEHTRETTAQLLNYLLLEWTFGPPSQPGWEFVFRIHHRSGVFGLFDGVDGGSNVLATGIKWRY